MNTNPAAKRVLCFGDSNTWGYIPGSKHQRYPADVRWPGQLQKLLGPGFEVIEEGLNSRGISHGDPRPGKEGRSALDYIIPCLDTHDPLDCVVVFLGTNELKSELSLTAEQIGADLKNLVNLIASRPSQFRASKPKVMIVVPPILDETAPYASKGGKYAGAAEKSKSLGRVFKKVADETSSLFVNVQDQILLAEDGVHMLPQGHAALAKAIYDELTH